jgi:hypothetical protein
LHTCTSAAPFLTARLGGLGGGAGRDFDVLIGTAGVLAASPVVREAFQVASLPYSAVSLTRADVMALLTALLPQLAAVAPGGARPSQPQPQPKAATTSARRVPTIGPADLPAAVRAILASLERLGVLQPGNKGVVPEQLLLSVRQGQARVTCSVLDSPGSDGTVFQVAKLGGSNLTQAELAALVANAANENGGVDMDELVASMTTLSTTVAVK